MKKIIALLLCGVLCFGTTAFAAEANQVSEPKEDLAKEFDNDFLKEAEYYVDKDGNFVSAADVWNPKKLEELFTRLNPNRKLRLERERLARKEAAKHPELNEETEQV